jgi:hypothetical protein
MLIGFFENNRFEENSLTMASTPTGYCCAALPHVNPPAGYAYVIITIPVKYLHP